MNKQRYLLVVSGPSGSGKDTVVSQLIADHTGVELSVSATTRAPRADEKDGCHYHFISKEQFEKAIKNQELLEYTQYVDNYYGTLKSEVDNRIEKKITCVLVIEVEGAAHIKEIYPDCTTIFLSPPDMTELERRLRGRGTESEERIKMRMARAEEELALASSDTYDFTVVNNNAKECAQEIYQILQDRQK